MTTVKVFDYVITTQTNITSLIKSNKQKLEITTKNPRKYKIITDKPITKHSSNLSCLDITSSDTTTSDPNSKIMENITTTYIRPWTRYTPGCFYNNTNSEPASNNIKKCNVRRKAEILQYKKNSSRLTKAQKHAQFARGINKYNKKQYAYQSVNSVRNVSLTTDANPYGMKAIGPPNMSSDAVADWLKFNKNTSDSTFLNNARLNSTGLIELKCEKNSIVIPTPLSSSDVPRVSQNKINSNNNPFPETPYGSTMDNALVMNKRDPLVNYTPVQRTYKGGSEKWPQSTWKEGDDGFPVGKKGDTGVLVVENESENVNYSFEDPNCVKLNIDITAAVTSNNDDANFSHVSNVLDDDVDTNWDAGLPASSSQSVHITFNNTDDSKNVKFVCIKSNGPSGIPSGMKVHDNAYNTDVIGHIPPDAQYNSSLPDNSSSGWCVIPCTCTAANTKVIQLYRSYTDHGESGRRFIINELQVWGGDCICINITVAKFTGLNTDDNGCYTTNDPNIILTFTSSEPTTDFTICDVIVDSGTLSAFKATSSTVYTATFTPLGSGTNHKQKTNISVGNPFTCESVCWIYNNITLPTLSNVSIISNNLTSTTLAKVGNIVTLTFTASETIKTPTVTFKSGGGNISDTNITYSNISGNTWTASYTTNQGDTVGLVTYAISNYAISNDEDLAGNTAAVVTTGSGLVNFVKTTVIYANITSNNPTPTSAKVDDVITLTFIASDSLIDLGVTFTSGGDPITDTNITYSNTSGNTWTASYIANQGDTGAIREQMTSSQPLEFVGGVVKCIINYTDKTGNIGTYSMVDSDPCVSFIKTDPYILTSLDLLKNDSGLPFSTAKVGDKIALQFYAYDRAESYNPRHLYNRYVTFKSGGTAIKNEVVQDVFAQQKQSDSYVFPEYPVYNFSYIVNEDDIEGPITYTINYTDKAGNTATRNGVVCDFDKTGPHIVSFSIDKEVLCVGEPVNVTIEFSEPINGYNPSDLFDIAPGIDGSAVGSIHDFLNTNDINFSFKFTPNQSLNVNSSNVLTLKNNWTDKAGNKAIMEIIPDTLTFDKSNLNILLPTLDDVNLKSNNSNSSIWAKVNDIITLTFTASKVIKNLVVTFKSGGIAITDTNSKQILNTSGNTWTASYKAHENDTEGEVTYNIEFENNYSIAGIGVTNDTSGFTGYVTFDKTSPSLQDVSISNVDGKLDLQKDDTIDFIVYMSEPILSGKLLGYLNILNGDNYQAIEFTTSESPSDNKLIGQYTIIDDDKSVDPQGKNFKGNDVKLTHFMRINNGITDLAGNPFIIGADTTIYHSYSHIYVDTTAPVISIIKAISTPSKVNSPKLEIKIEGVDIGELNNCVISTNIYQDESVITFTRTNHYPDAWTNAASTAHASAQAQAALAEAQAALTTAEAEAAAEAVAAAVAAVAVAVAVAVAAAAAAAAAANNEEMRYIDITFNNLNDGTYDNKTIIVTHNGNARNFPIPTFVIDTTPPVITIIGNNPATVELGSTYFDDGATASDLSGNVTVVTTGTVDTTTVGTYTINYTSTDDLGNTGTAQRIVNVVDTTPPVITITGDNPVTIELGSTYTDAGATATDLSHPSGFPMGIPSTGSVNTDSVGVYTYTYTVMDKYNNTSTTATRYINVVDTRPPVLTVSQGTDTVELGGTWTDAGATADDGSDVITTGTVDTTTVGTYTITYNATDDSNNVATQVTRTVNVVDTTPPVITITGYNPTTVEVGATYTELGATATDASGESVNIVTTGTVPMGDENETWELGQYIITYSATDAYNNTGTAQRIVNVVDTTPSKIIIKELTPNIPTLEAWEARPDEATTNSDSIQLQFLSADIPEDSLDINDVVVTKPSNNTEGYTLSLQKQNWKEHLGIATFTVTEDGEYTIYLPANTDGYEDWSGNVNEQSNTFTFTRDTVRPAVTRYKITANNEKIYGTNPSNYGYFTVTFITSKPIKGADVWLTIPGAWETGSKFTYGNPPTNKGFYSKAFAGISNVLTTEQQKIYGSIDNNNLEHNIKFPFTTPAWGDDNGNNVIELKQSGADTLIDNLKEYNWCCEVEIHVTDLAGNKSDQEVWSNHLAHLGDKSEGENGNTDVWDWWKKGLYYINYNSEYEYWEQATPEGYVEEECNDAQY